MTFGKFLARMGGSWILEESIKMFSKVSYKDEKVIEDGKKG